MRFAYQFPSAFVGITIAGELGDLNGRPGGLERRFVNFSPSLHLSTPNLQTESWSVVQTSLDGTRPCSTEQPSYHRPKAFLQGKPGNITEFSGTCYQGCSALVGVSIANEVGDWDGGTLGLQT